MDESKIQYPWWVRSEAAQAEYRRFLQQEITFDAFLEYMLNAIEPRTDHTGALSSAQKPAQDLANALRVLLKRLPVTVAMYRTHG